MNLNSNQKTEIQLLMNPYKILGLEEGATAQEIKSAYRKMAAKYHPDQGGDAWVFQQVQDAYDELTGKKKVSKPKSAKKPQAKPEQKSQAQSDPFGFEVPPNPNPNSGFQNTSWKKPRHRKIKRAKKSSVVWWVAGSVATVLLMAVGGVGIWFLAGQSSQLVSEKQVEVAEPATQKTIANRSAPSKQIDSKPSIERSRHGDESLIAIEKPRLDDSEKPMAMADTSGKPKAQTERVAKNVSLPDDPLLHLTFDEENLLWDDCKQAVVGRSHGASTRWSRVGQGLYLDGKSYATVSSKLPYGDSPRTLAFWAKSNSPDEDQYMVKYGGVFSIACYANQWRFMDWKGGLATLVSDNGWHHHCVTYDGETLTDYLDGEAEGEVKRRLETAPSEMFLGALSGTENKLYGMLDELVVFGETLDSDQVALLVDLGIAKEHLKVRKEKRPVFSKKRIGRSPEDTAKSAIVARRMDERNGIGHDGSSESARPIGSREDGFTTLFDGSSLSMFRGFKSAKPSKGWKVVGESLKLDNEESGHLLVRQPYSSFDLRFDWRVEANGNSGVLYRVDLDDAHPHEKGIEYQLLDDKSYSAKVKPRHLTGSVYDLYAPTRARINPIGDWNSGRIVVEGDHIEHWLNGVLVAKAEVGSASWNRQIRNSKFKQTRSFAKLKLGYICFQDHGSAAWFRNIRIKDLSSDAVEPIIGDFRVRWTEGNGNTGTVKYTFKENGAVLKDGRDYAEWEKQSDRTYRIRYSDRDRGTVTITFEDSNKFEGTHTWSKIKNGRKTSKWSGTRL